MKVFRFILLAIVFASFAPGSLTADVIRVGFGSCAHETRPQPIWDAVNALKPDLFLMIGDNIYGDTREIKVLREKYDQLGAIPAFRELRRNSRLLGVWDDHDYGENNAGVEYPMKRESQQAFLDFFGVSKDSPRRKQEGVYYSEIHGKPGNRLQIILLDGRYFRSPLKHEARPNNQRPRIVPNTDPQSTILGDAQWKWLEGELRKPAELRLVASGIQVVAQDHGGEKWMNYPHERERLIRLIKETKASGVVFLSGDRHLAELSMMNTEVGYPLYDLTSSGLNQGRPTWRPLEVNQHRVATMNYGNNFGWIEMDWDASLLSLEIRDEQGDVRLRQKLPLNLLKVPEKK